MQIRRERRNRRLGFTLLEVLLVLAIIGVIFALVAPQLLGRQKEANIKAAQASINGLEQALKLYAIDHQGEFPQGGQDVITTLLEGEDKDGKQSDPYLEKRPVDPWGEPIYYEYPNSKASGSNKPAIWSAGPNRQNENGGGDDITNWAEA